MTTMGRSSSRDPAFWEKWVYLKELKSRRHSFQPKTQQGRPSSRSSCETCPMDGEPYTTTKVPQPLVKLASEHKECSMTDSGFVEPKCWSEPELVELQQATNQHVQPALRPAYGGDLHFDGIAYANMHPGPSHLKLADIRVEIGLIQMYRKYAISMADVDDERFFDNLNNDLSADEHELKKELQTLQNDSKDLERQTRFASVGSYYGTYTTPNPPHISARDNYPTALTTSNLLNLTDSQLPPPLSGRVSQQHHLSPPKTSSATSSHPSSHILKHNLPPSRSGRSESSTNSQTEMAEGEIYHGVRQLSSEAMDLRSEIYALRLRQTNIEQGTDKEEENVLKSLRRVIATSDPWAEGVMIPPNLLFDAEKVISRRRDDMGPLLDDILRLEQALALTEYRLRQAEEELHQHYIPASQTPRNTVLRSPHHSEYDSDDGSEGSTTHRFPAIGGNLPAMGKTEDYETDSATLESTEDALQEGGNFDPSRYHPKYIELVDLVGIMKLKQERLFYFEHKLAKLQDRKEQREIVNLHLSKEDEEELQWLPEQIAKLQEEEVRGLNEVEDLRRECLLKRYIDEKEMPVEKDHWSDDDEKERRESEESLPALEAWIINPAVARAQKRAPKITDWGRATCRQQEFPRNVILKKIQELNTELSIESKLNRLKLHQRAAIEHFLDRRNRDESDQDFQWIIAQIEPRFRQGRLRCATTYLERVRNDSKKKSVMIRRTSSQVMQTPQATLSPPSQHTVQSFSPHIEMSSRQLAWPEVVVNPPSEAQQQSPSSLTLKAGLLAPSHPTMAISQTSGLTNSALTANTDGIRDGPSGGLESRIYPWMFGQLANSRAEVRLLATIMQAIGVAVLDIEPKKTAGQIMKIWNDKGYPSLEHRDLLMSAQNSDVVESAELLRYEGYDKLLVKQVVGYAFDKEKRDPDAEAEYDYSGGYEDSLPDF